MNIKDFAYSLLETQEELEYLRRENAHLKEMLSIYQESQHDQLKANEQLFGSLLCAALDPDSRIHKTFGK